ncbi:MAG: TRAP transporter large permease [Desulfobacterales bacterium]|nr:TRAP transporter large permease [Desulfobacterales bacterium]
MLLFISLIFFGLLLLGTPIGFALGITAVLSLAKMAGVEQLPILLNPGSDVFIFKMVSQRFYAGLDMFTLMAMPFFIFAGAIMNKSGITHRLVKFSNTLVGHLRGGLAHANIVASIFFSGMTGAAVSDTAAIGTMLIPAMKEDGYDTDFSAAVTAASSIIGPTIPPSNMMVIYGSLMSVSIAGLFAAGFVPGLLIALFLMILSGFIAKKRRYPKSGRSSLKQILIATREAILPLLMPIIILGGILSGIFTPTEAAAVAVGYAFIIGFFVLRTLKLKDIPDLLYQTGKTTGVVFLIIGSASILGWILTMERVPEAVAAGFLRVSNNPHVILLLILILMLIVGMFMDIAAALIILGPILHPIAVNNLGINPIHFGIIMVLSLNLALMTPPVGACLFVACNISKLSLEALTKAIWPFIVVEVIALFIIAYWSDLVLFFPRLVGVG